VLFTGYVVTKALENSGILNFDWKTEGKMEDKWLAK